MIILGILLILIGIFTDVQLLTALGVALCIIGLLLAIFGHGIF